MSAMARIDVAVLGRPHVAVDGVPAPLLGRSLALAVRLAIAGQSPVALHRLADVWPDADVSDGAIRVALTRLRQVLGPNALTRVEHGYLLTPSAHLDADRFERLLAQARDGATDLRARLAAIEEALRTWTGSAYEGLERSNWVEYEAIRLDELREHALDVRFELLIENGVHAELVGELTAALARTPERDRRCELLALALYRAGRQTSALDLIARTRRRLREDFGLNLSESLALLERQILDHDPVLNTAAGSQEEQLPDPRLRSAAALMREGLVRDSLTIAEAALAAARTDGRRRQVADALLVCAQATTLLGTGDPNAQIDEAQTIARSMGDGRLLARAAITRFGSGVSPDRTQAMIELGEPLELLPHSAPERVELLCAAAVIVTFSDLDTAADRVLGAARRTYEAIGDARSEAVWLAAQSIVGSVRGDGADAAAELAHRAGAAAASVDDPAVETVVIHAQLRAAYSVGDLDRVDDLVDRLEVVALRAVLPFGIVRTHLCRITNALAHGQLDAVPELIDRALDVGRRLTTHSAEPATRSQRLALDLELDDLGRQLDGLRALAGATSMIPMAALAAYAGDSSDLDRLRRNLHDVRRDSSFPVIAALVALAAARHRDAETAHWARRYLVALDDRTVFVGFGTLGLGFARFFVGLCDRALGDLVGARIAFESAVNLSERSGGTLWCVHARLWLAETLLELGGGAERAEAERQVISAEGTGILGVCSRAAAHASDLERRLAEFGELDGRSAGLGRNNTTTQAHGGGDAQVPANPR